MSFCLQNFFVVNIQKSHKDLPLKMIFKKNILTTALGPPTFFFKKEKNYKVIVPEVQSFISQHQYEYFELSHCLVSSRILCPRAKTQWMVAIINTISESQIPLKALTKLVMWKSPFVISSAYRTSSNSFYWTIDLCR